MAPFITDDASDIDMSELPTSEPPASEAPTTTTTPATSIPPQDSASTDGTSIIITTAPIRQRRVHRPPISQEDAEAREQERRRRWRETGFAVDEFDRETKKSRDWYEYLKGQRAVWENEKKRIEERKPRVEEELRKINQDLVNIAAAEKAFEERYGLRAEEGRKNCEALTRYQKYLKMENDEEPEL